MCPVIRAWSNDVLVENSRSDTEKGGKKWKIEAQCSCTETPETSNPPTKSVRVLMDL